jgi:hypothetical protein
MSSDRNSPTPPPFDESAVSKLLQYAATMFSREAARLGAGAAPPALESVAPPSSPPLQDRMPPLPRAAPPGVDTDRLRRQATEFVESLLAAVGSAPKREDQAPLLRCLAPVAAGEHARATFRLANDGVDATEASLYCTNFVADSGYEIPAVRVSVVPRRAAIAPKGEVAFEIDIAVPAQTPRGTYSGLLQATGAHYAKAVLTVEVT